ncbi:MAG: zinc-ribbon domain-containing protein [Oscillospiraceae bacterium]|nr:zinc-ribbon domain-containing protein [Oscillospiraceae bacterium]
MSIPTPKYDELKKLLEEQSFEKSAKEYKLFEAIITTLGEIESDINETNALMTEIDEDLADIEGEIYEEVVLGDLSEHLYEEDEVFELECPHCQAKVFIDESVLMQDKMNCPNCGKELEFDLEGEGGCGGCCGGCQGC